MPANTTNQHYVPRMLLRGFTTPGSSKQVHAFDKRTGNSFTCAIESIAAEPGYYDLGAMSLDNAMTRADGEASKIIRRLRERSSVAGMNQYDRGMLAMFVVLQILRTRGFQEGYRHIGHSALDEIKRRGLTPPEGWAAQLTPENERREYLRVIPGFVKGFMPHILNKDMLLLKTDRTVPFCISDNPVALNNTVNPSDGFLGTIGLAVRGIEIFLPISTTLTLAYYCPSIGQMYEAERWRLQRMGGFINESAFTYLQSRDTGKALVLNTDNVRFQNSLQIHNAERFVIACRDDFADAADMVRRIPEARFGPRVTTSQIGES